MMYFAIVLLGCAAPQDGAHPAQMVVRHDAGGVMDESGVTVVTWRAEGDELLSGARRLPASDLVALRERILERRCLLDRFPADPGLACFEALGITGEIFESRRGEWLPAVLSDFWKGWEPTPALLAEAGPRLDWVMCRPAIVRWTCGGGIHSVHGASTEFELMGAPPIRLKAWSDLPGRLPWLVQFGDERWASADVELSRRLLPFAPVEGSCASSLDEDSYWKGAFWSDRTFWRQPEIRGELDRILARLVFEQLDGWHVADDFLSVEDVRTGAIGYTLPAIDFELAWRGASPVERVLWSNPRSDRGLRHSWMDLISVWQAAKHTVAREEWIDTWKRAGPERTLTLELVGNRIGYDARLEEVTLLAWRAAGFRGVPDWKLQFRRGRAPAATVFLSRDQRGALVESAQGASGEHWLDAHAFEFHPHAVPRRFGLVDPDGRFEMRALQ